ncbi:MAG: glycosyltransferase family 4 protein [Lutisporaceae bacterium]
MKKELKSVWIISKYGSPKKYGVSSKPYRTAKFLSESGINVYLISSDSNHLAEYPKSECRYNWEKEEKLNHIWIKTLKYKKSASIKRILSWFDFEWYLFRLDKRKLERPDVVIVSSLSLLTVLYGLYLKKIYKCKLVLEIRDIYPLTFTEELGVSSFNPIVLLFKIIEKIGYMKSDLIVGTMPNLSRHVKDVLGYEKKVFFSPLGINDNWDLIVEPSKRIDELFPDYSCVVIGYAGSMGRTNALDSFIKAIEILQSNANLYFVLVGQGDQKEEYEKRLKNCRNVTIGPRIEQYEIPYFLSKCDILYLSTKDSKVWEYGQSMNKLVDYMMAGKPVVASYSGYPSMLNEAGSGTFVNTNSTEAIIEGIRKYANMSIGKRQEIGSKGKKWIEENYTNYIVCKRYLDKLCDLIRFEES